MVATEQQAPGRATLAQRWLARLALVAAAGAVLVPLAAIGFRASVALVGAGLVGMGLAAAGVWWALTHKGLVRGLAIALVVAAPLTTLVLYTRAGLTWVVLVALAVLGVAVAAGRAALARDPAPGRMREHEAPPPRRPYLIMNPRSGGGKVARFGLKDKAEAHGATVALLEGPEIIDVGQLARDAVANGADLLGGEALVLDTPVRCSIQPLALRVRVPRDRPGVPDAKPQIDWKRLWQMALTVPGTGRATPHDG